MKPEGFNGLFLIGCENDLIGALIAHGVPVEGFVSDIFHFAPLSVQCQARLIVMQEGGLAGFKLDEVVARIKALTPAARLILLMSHTKCPDPEAMDVLACFRPPYDYERIACWLASHIGEIDEQQAVMSTIPYHCQEGINKRDKSSPFDPSEEQNDYLRQVEWRRLDNPVRNAQRGLPSDTIVRQHTLVLMNPKGGVGRTYLAINLAAHLGALNSLRVLLLDLDMSGGDTGLLLNIKQGSGLVDLLPLLPNLKYEEFVKYRISLPSLGFDVVLGPAKPELGDLITPKHIQDLIYWLNNYYDVIVVDTNSDPLDDRFVSIASLATKVILVLTPDSASVRKGRLSIEALNNRKVNLSDRLLIVLNRLSQVKGVAAEDIYRLFGAYPVAGIPDEGERLYTALMSGNLSWVGGATEEGSNALKRMAAVLYPSFFSDMAAKKKGSLFKCRFLKNFTNLSSRLAGR